MNTIIVSLGGSIVAPDKPDPSFLQKFKESIARFLGGESGRRIILIVGGGGVCRDYQAACRSIRSEVTDQDLDWIGIMATRLNAELVRAAFGGLCGDRVVMAPPLESGFHGKVLVAAGWKPGFSTDFVAVTLAKAYGAKTVINLSNIEKVYTDDPKKNPEAKPLDRVSGTEHRAMLGDGWSPGKNAPFDPGASKESESLGLEVVFAAGRNLDNLTSILEGRPFVGTVIG